MRVLIVGGGGREHALAHNVHRSPRHPEVFIAPGNAGTAECGENVPIPADNVAALLGFAQEERMDLTIVGPEAPLCAGIVNRFQQAGLRIFGPTAEAARLEGDKAYAKDVMQQNRIPCAQGRTFTKFADAKTYLETRDTAQVVKATGLAGGKGVVVCDDPADALLAAERMMVDGLFGDAGRRVVIEEKLVGREVSVMAMIDGSNIYMLETAQDYKRLGAGDTGPNTGGMGAISPASAMSWEDQRAVETQVIIPLVDALRRDEIDYRGVLYCGLMLTAAGPKVLEFNCRLGDPEAQVLLARLKSDVLDLVDAAIDARLDAITLDWDPRPAVCVVIASQGYPERYETGRVISGLAEPSPAPDVFVYHAGTRRMEHHVLTDGGRVVGVTAIADSIAQARSLAYETVNHVRFEGSYSRPDVGMVSARAGERTSVL